MAVYLRILSFLKPHLPVLMVAIVATAIFAVADAAVFVLLIPFVEALFVSGGGTPGGGGSGMDRLLDATVYRLVDLRGDPLDAIQGIIILPQRNPVELAKELKVPLRDLRCLTDSFDAVQFIAREGHTFLGLYDFDLATGTWVHKYAAGVLPEFSLDQALSNIDGEPAILSLALRQQLYRHYLTEAQKIADQLRNEPDVKLIALAGDLGELQFFAMPEDERQRH